MVNQYEPRDIYERRTQQVATYLSTVRAAQPPAAPEPQKLPWWKKGLSTTLDVVGRPLAATSSALAAGLRGEDAGMGFMQGLRGQGEVKSFEDVLKQQGMGGGWQRKTLGFLGSAAIDPTTLATLPFGGGGSLLMRGVRGLTPGLAKGIEATPLVGGLLGAGKAAAQPIENVISRAYESAQTPLAGMEKLLSKSAQIPKVGGIYKAGASVVDPNLTENPMRRILNASDRISQEMPSIAESIKAPVRLAAKVGGRDVLGPLDDMGRMTFQNGRQVQDVFALSDAKYRDFLTPQQLALADTMHKRWAPIFEYANEIGVPMKEYNIQPDEWFLPRVPVDEAAAGRYKPRVTGTEKGAQKGRTIVSAEQAEHAGKVYLPVVEGFEQRVDEMLMAIANIQLAKRLEPLARRQNLGAIAGAKGVAVEAGTRVGAAESLRLMVQRVRRGEVPSQSQIKAVAKGFPELQAQLDEAMSINPTGFELAMGEMGAELQQRLGITPKEFMQAVAAARNARIGGGGFSAEEIAQPWRAGTRDMPLRNVSRVDIAEALNTLGKRDTETAQILEDFYRGVFRMDKEERANALEAVAAAVKTEKATLKGEAQAAGEAYRGIRAQGEAAIEGRREAEGVAYLKDMWFTPEEANMLESTLLPAAGAGGVRQKVAGALGLAQNTSALMRTLMSGADLSAGMIQGLPMLARNPLGWLDSFVRGAVALFDTQANDRLIASPEAQRLMQRASNVHLATGTGGEFLGQAGAIGSALGRIPVIGGILQKVAASTIGAGARAFDVTGNAIRIKAGNGLADMAERYGRNPMEAGDFVNRMTGVSVIAGLPQNWKAFEGAMLLFAQRYTRASMAMGLDALTRGGMAGAEARATFSQMLVGGLAWYSNVARLAGQEPNLDPSKSNFLALNVGNDVVGIGSIWVSMAKLLARVAQDPSQAVPSNWDELTKDNPITQWWRGRGSPVGAMLYDKLIAGQDFIGAPLDSPVDMARNLGSKFLPFTLDAYLMQQGQQADIKSLPAQLTGFRSFPAPKSEWRETVAQELYQRPYAELDPVAQAKVEQDSRVKNIPAPVGERGERQRALGEIYDTYNQKVDQLATMVDSGNVTKNQFRLAIAKLNSDRSIRMESVPEAKARGNRQPTAQEAARKQYYDIMGQTDELGAPNFEGAEAYLAGLPSSSVAYIEQKEMAGIERLPENARDLMRERLEARRVTAPYWEIQDTILKKYGIDTTGVSPAEQLAMQDTPRYKAAIKETKATREQMRRQNPAIERAISEWYGRVALAARRS